jgi:anti-sigma-K factor RskA
MAGLAAAVAVALLAGGLVGRLTTPPPPAAVARFNLAGHASMQGVTAGVVDLKREGLAVVTFSHLPAPPAGMVYELWLITPGGRADPAGVFAPDAAGARSVVVDRSLAGYSLMAVTVETGPDGALSPSQAPQIYGNIV